MKKIKILILSLPIALTTFTIKANNTKPVQHLPSQQTLEGLRSSSNQTTTPYFWDGGGPPTEEGGGGGSVGIPVGSPEIWSIAFIGLSYIFIKNRKNRKNTQNGV